MPSEEHQNTTPAKRAVKKIRTASLVISLARGWQHWANDHHTKQAQEPSGWVPGEEEPLPSILSKDRLLPAQSILTKSKQVKEEAKFPDTQEPKDNEGESPSESNEALTKLNIRSKKVNKTVESKIYERGSGVSLLSDKYEKDDGCSETDEGSRELDKFLNGKMSPTRRRKCSNLVSELTKGWKQIEQEEKAPELERHNYRSDSLDTEDSGYGGDPGDRLEAEDSSQELVTPIRIKRPSSSL